MHSSKLRDGDFEMVVRGHPVALAEYFRGFTNTKRLGLLAPNRLEGVGAVNLVMAHATAFYNAYRALGEDFFAYPDYFTFQSREPKAAYGMFDIWPAHKDVLVGAAAAERLNAITDRAVNILLDPTAPRPRTSTSGSRWPRPSGSSKPAMRIRPPERLPTPTWSSAARPIRSPLGAKALLSPWPTAAAGRAGMAPSSNNPSAASAGKTRSLASLN